MQELMLCFNPGQGIDISFATPTQSVQWYSNILSEGYQYVIVESIASQTVSANAQAQLYNARSAGLATATYCYLNFINGNSGARQVLTGLEACGSEAAYLGFFAIDVEQTNPNTADYCISVVSSAVEEVESVGLQPVIYSNKYYWALITDNDVEDFSGLLLWEPNTLNSYDINLPNLSKVSNTFGGWTSRVGKQFNLDTKDNPVILNGVHVDFDTFDQSAFSPLPNPNYRPPDLSVHVLNLGNTPTLFWNNSVANLYEMPNLNSAPNMVPNATSPFTLPMTDPTHFYFVQ